MGPALTSCAAQSNDKYWHPSNEINLKKNKCGCVMELGFSGDEVSALAPCNLTSLFLFALLVLSHSVWWDLGRRVVGCLSAMLLRGARISRVLTWTRDDRTTVSPG